MVLGTLIIAYFFESGVPMKDVQERLGHSDIQTTMNIYTHVTENSRENSAKLFFELCGVLKYLNTYLNILDNKKNRHNRNLVIKAFLSCTIFYF